ncbi:FtsK/SpoIIIE-like protein [Bacillus phage Shbh1]|uniref:DNA translocase-like protein n=1 Tax=Bacillus phage Shbh1 TaxID=1796992 RepID=A0A142F150_9CAUD|nr:FtsK/SpoIIIE-like protein [Bacillus phage Shbh1]AMQ66507.1 DNA translocase-like protein [Bacillus phage Shbh1]
MIRLGNNKNFSNSFTKVKREDLSDQLNWVLEASGNHVFGVEVKLGELEEGEITLISPPHVRLEEHTSVGRTKPIKKSYKYYEGYLSHPFFLPLYEALNGDYVDNMISLSELLGSDEEIFIQWLFKRGYGWRKKAVQMYSSYLEGNDTPLTFKLGRLIQDKTLHTLNKVSDFDTSREYEDQVEHKILGEGFRFQLRVGVYSKRYKTLKNEMERLLQKYDSHNALRLFRQRSGKVQTLVEDCIITPNTNFQIISRIELHSLFGGNRIATEPKTEVAPYTSQNVDIADVVGLLPSHSRSDPESGVSIQEDIVSKVAEALKRVKIIDTARLYNESISVGVRLTVVQFNIPKGKTLTQIVQKSKDIQAALGTPSIGIEQGDHPDTVKIMVPNDEQSVVSLRELLEDESFHTFRKKNPLPFIVGVDEVNNPIYLSLTKLVHLLVAGTTGSGKSVFLNSMIVTLMMNHKPEELQMYMIDPKQVELQQYVDFPHVRNVVTEMDRAVVTLHRLTKEMDKRYTLFREAGAKNIQIYNQKMKDTIPYIVCVIDEYADLRDVAPDVEDYIARLGQKARAAGIHLVLATQRPSADIVSGRIKANIPNAISFNLSNSNNYKTVFGTGIPYSLLGKGDGVMRVEGYPKEFQRFQSAIISPDESQEEAVYYKLSKALGEGKGRVEDEDVEDYGYNSLEEVKEQETIEPINEEEDLLNKLKHVIATTKETKVAPLRDELGVKTSTMSELMNKLVEEGWLVKHKSKAKGYELIADEETLSKWKEES